MCKLPQYLAIKMVYCGKLGKDFGAILGGKIIIFCCNKIQKNKTTFLVVISLMKSVLWGYFFNFSFISLITFSLLKVL